MSFIKVITIGLSMGALLFLSGCAVRVPTYNATADSVVKLRQMNTRMYIAQVTSEDSEDSVLCRLGRRVKTPQNQTFDKYIENAFKEELKMADMYSENSDIKISIFMNDLNANSGVASTGSWKFDANISSSNGKSFNLVSNYTYETSFNGGVTCNELMPNAFLPAVKKFIYDIITNPSFNELLQK